MTRWIPLESNPEVLNSWANKAGLDKEELQFSDIYGLDEELLDMVSKPVKAVLLLFPISKTLEAKRREEDDLIRSEASSPSLFNSVIWIKQTISNACGTIGLLHALANTGIKFAPGSPLAQFIEACKGAYHYKTPEERAEFLETTPLFAEIHAETASTGQSAVPTDLDTDLHFTCFVEAEMEGVPHVVELDGRRAGIMDRGKIYNDLLTDVASLVKETYIKGSSGSIQFSMTSLGPPAEW
ncbi:peptidase C12, ubiquitin carboxyl-terminal hydrolase 1 [Lentinula edodes]|uniref:peptidase C12, ubiquitin carboxyl-terminal hydrolase 1 n=1 Tax=Lentinula edodes TaxID=5353 RepID=UPI001E8E4361|nr:peptidase C12, ubiquitin carboxyl-terminal hydrolase 1 [Lentinula edodes]KAH7879112.1 peptidase C12, ubiquitin carboxyl-terminal hydrolase 1 [Lentinula edodes]